MHLQTASAGAGLLCVPHAAVHAAACRQICHLHAVRGMSMRRVSRGMGLAASQDLPLL